MKPFEVELKDMVFDYLKLGLQIEKIIKALEQRIEKLRQASKRRDD